MFRFSTNYHDFFVENEHEVAVQLMQFSFTLTQDLETRNFSNKYKIILDYIHNYNLGNRKLVLNGAHEHIGIEPLIGLLLSEIQIPKDQIKICLSIPSDRFNGYEVEIIPTANANFMHYYTKLQNSNIDWYNIELVSHILTTSYSPKMFRAVFTKLLLDIAGDRTRASFGIGLNADLFKSETSYWQNIMSPYTIPMHVDKPMFTSYEDIYDVSPTLYQSLINIVQESMGPDTEFTDISEKSYKPFAWYQMPLFLAPHGQANLLRKLGFDMFDDYFSGHVYNNEANDSAYNMKLIKVVKQFIDKYPTLEEVSNLRKEIFPRLEYNHKHIQKIIDNNPFYLQL